MQQAQVIKSLGRYNIISTLGRGGMGIVYQAVDSFLERTVALKVAGISSLDIEKQDKNKLNRCLKEARLAAQFIHPNIVITYDAGVEHDLFYIALEHIDGVGLHKHADKRNLLPQKQMLEIIYNTCFALDYIHQKGYVHLDIKPSNIMLTRREEVKLMDFGISRFLKDEQDAPAGVAIQGTPSYMSPEQTGTGGIVDQQSDIFSLGVVLYELLSGKKPFKGKTVAETFYNINHVEPTVIGEVVSGISADLEDVIHRTIDKRKDKRFQSVRDLAGALLPIIKGRDSGTLDRQDKKKIAYLKRLSFFKHFQYSELMDAIKISSWSYHERKTRIFGKDDKDNHIYFLVQGKARLYVNKEVKLLEQGECFGETAILYKMPRTAEVIAETNCIVMAINANLLKQSNEALQVKFLREFYNKKILQLVDANLKLIQVGK
jgi:serine/threonine-protein kinase